MPEKSEENITKEFQNIVKKDLGLDIVETDIIAAHCLPGKPGFVKPIILKLKNTETKRKIMMKKRELKNDIRFHDDITQRNIGLMTRLKQTQLFESVWFYNCSIYAKQTKESNRIKFDIFDNIDAKVKNTPK